MKKIIAVALLSAATGDVYAVSVLNTPYGAIDLTARAYAGHFFGDDRASEFYGSNTWFRFGAQGKAKINDDLSALGTYEGQLIIGDKKGATVESESGSSLNTRFAFGGVTGAWGTATYGRQNGAANLTTAWTDVALTDGYGNHGLGVGVDKFATKRASDVFKYSASLGQAKLDLDYKLRTTKDSYDADSDSYSDTDNSALGAAVTYGLLSNLSLGASYTLGQQGDNPDAKLWTLGAKYDDGSLYGAFIYGQGQDWYKVGYDHDGYEAALGYKFADNLSLMSLWNMMDASKGSTSFHPVDYVTLGAKYQFNRRLSLAAEYRFNNRTAEDQFKDVSGQLTDAKNDMQLAMRYDF